MDVSSIELLKNLFEKCNGDQSSSESDEAEDLPSFGPGDIKSKKKKSSIVKTLENPLLKRTNECSTAIKSIEEWEQSQKEDEELIDSRLQPEYSITYKQSVTTEDIYLQMGLKTPATSSCEDMIVEIKIPNETTTIEQMDLSVEEEKIELKTSIYRLKLMLPQKVNPQKGKAEYDSTKKILKLTLRMNREYDFVNF
ncbi:hypothetical protein PVAND_005733 [Polypedilum vanderplanki]|uniref:PIH1D1/2/3 CS-like domain-containing protein n=1 Tax=Polypedilum vanderplanki TaxID=319348 RepID=A0A9J6C0Z0_POLVA|nr:hypothetical protein PVAND_005733 [Polypedilum vanderplanki]